MRHDDDFPSLDTTVASAARMYDYAIGGTDNYPADRQALEALEDMMPGAFSMARANRRYLERAVRFLTAECGIRQFLDYGSGLPTQNNVHQIAQAIAPDTRVVYIDLDPVVVRHQRVSALLTENETTAFLLADARNVEEILGHPDTRRLIDFSQPAAALYLSFLHLIPDDDDPWAMVGKTMDRLAPGSYLGISHAASADPAVREKFTGFFQQVTGGHFGRVREPAEVARFFSGLEIAEPGLVEVTGWRSDEPAAVSGMALTEFGGVGRKPA